MRCELVSWEQFRTLARQLALFVQSSDFKPDMIVAIGRGAYGANIRTNHMILLSNNITDNLFVQ
jgi:hypoxanthine phosphoribosyltransferase